MTTTPKNGNGWKQLGIAVLIPLLLGAVAFGVLSESTRHNERDITSMEQRVEARLDRIENKLDQLLVRE